MTEYTLPIGAAETRFLFDADATQIALLAENAGRIIYVTDERIRTAHPSLFAGKETLIVPEGEAAKNLQTLDMAIRQLLDWNVDRHCLLIGIGGGAITDFTGFLAGIYKRGLSCGFVPTTVLAMVDAAIGGKNGLDIGAAKNMIGLTRQPQFILYDYKLLQSLPETEWVNGFAEIIKHAAIADPLMFAALEQGSIAQYRQQPSLLSALIQKNALFKVGVVQEDEWETGERKKLNFGHTLAHAIEQPYGLSHGAAVAIGMHFAAKLSESILGFTETYRLRQLITQYSLPLTCDYDVAQVLELMRSDKKSTGGQIDFILLQDIGQASIHRTAFEQIQKMIIASGN